MSTTTAMNKTNAPTAPQIQRGDPFLAAGDALAGTLAAEAFGFKNGVPADTDFVFDVRCLPNPHWEVDLRPLSGCDAAVIKFLESYAEVEQMFSSIFRFLADWTPRFEKENRSYMTVSIGCTSGKHRSVYLAERVAAEFGKQRENVSIRHRDMS